MMFGSHEPDHFEDVLDDLQWEYGPNETTNRIYFNGIAFQNPTGTNPNLGLLQSRVEVITLETYNVFLGVWIDCNGDNYVGMAESAAREYSSAVLLDKSICPDTFGDEDAWNGAPNYNGWVSEFIPIGQTWKNATVRPDGTPSGVPDDDDNDNSNDLRIIRDPKVRVWGDYGYPTTGTGAQGTCALAPQPRGTFQTTGGLITFLDCPSGLMERWNQVWINGIKLLGTPVVPGLDPNNNLGMKFNDPNNGNQPGHPLNVATFGVEDAEESPVHFSDCSDPEFVNTTRDTQAALEPHVGEATARQVSSRVPRVTLPNPEPSAGGGMSVAAIANVTFEETGNQLGGDCNYENDRGNDFYRLSCRFLGGACVGEADFNNAPTNGKVRSQWNFNFNDFSRGQQGLVGVNFTAVRNTANSTVGQVDDAANNQSDDLGDLPAFPVLFGGGGQSGVDGNAGLTIPGFLINGQWTGGVQLVKRGPRTVVANADEGTVEPADAYNMTYYAYVDPALVSDRGLVLPGGSEVYGPCGTPTENDPRIVLGWVCDRDQWYRNPPTPTDPQGTRQPEPPRGFARPGDTYNLRDIDCLDGSNNAGVPLGAPVITGKACPTFT